MHSPSKYEKKILYILYHSVFKKNVYPINYIIVLDYDIVYRVKKKISSNLDGECL